MHVITRRMLIKQTVKHRDFIMNDGSTRGWSFKVDENGNPILENEAQKSNFNKAIKGVEDGTVIDKGIVEYDQSYWEPATCKCDCGEIVTLRSSWANPCYKCGCEYNMSGQMLAPQECWGEETGEIF